MRMALLIVDMQKDYFPGGKMELVGIAQAALNVAGLQAEFRARKLPVIHIQHLAINPGASFFLPETEGASIHESVAPQKDELVLTKHFPNSFRETALLETLEAENIEEIVVCGAMSHMCIDTTVRAAFDLGVSCVVIEDGCATRDLTFEGLVIEAAKVHGAFMASLGAAFARVIKSSDVRDVLDG